tara:strand:- start:1447 stop:2511 length:1065 start_codon:yes stop_codon:yes gene_type:complete
MVTGCSSIVPTLDKVMPDKRTEYKKSKSLPDLEVPPDLTTDAIQDRMAIPIGRDDGSTTASYSTFQERAAERERNVDTERTESAAITMLENEHSLVARGAATQIWSRLREFWNGLGYELEFDDEELGVMETGWNENQQTLTRNKFKIFAEPGQEADTTILYISYRGEELVGQGENVIWQSRDRDVPFERKVVERIEENLSYGVSSVVGTRTEEYGSQIAMEDISQPSDLGGQRAKIIDAGGGKAYLSLAEEFTVAWESVASALWRAGIPVDQQDQNRGLYIIRMPKAENAEKNEGVFSKLKFWSGDEGKFQLSLTGVGKKTELVVLNKDGKWEVGEVAGDLLARLNQELNAEVL